MQYKIETVGGMCVAGYLYDCRWRDFSPRAATQETRRPREFY